MSNKARYWCGILYPENMIDDWQTEIGDILQLPFCYIVHDKDQDQEGEHRKTHVHVMLCFPNTTTQKHALSVYQELNKPGFNAINTCEAVFNVRHMYNYLIHDTDTCKKKGKFLYSKAERISGNNFDIGQYEQVSVAEKDNMAQELCDIIVQERFYNFLDFYMYVRSNLDSSYFSIIKSYSGMFERLCKGNFLKFQYTERKEKNDSNSKN